MPYEIPFIANNLLDFFSRTRYTLPTSPFPIILIISKLAGLTSTSFTLIELELYVLGKPFDCLSLPGYDGPTLADINWAALFFGNTNSMPRSAVEGLPSWSEFRKWPWAPGSDATRLSFLAGELSAVVPVSWLASTLLRLWFVGEGGWFPSWFLISLWGLPCGREGSVFAIEVLMLFVEMASFATSERVFVILPRKRDCRILLPAFGLPEPSLSMLLPRKKLRILSGKWLVPFCLVEDVDKPDKLRFSVGSDCELDEEEWKSCVMVERYVTRG